MEMMKNILQIGINFHEIDVTLMVEWMKEEKITVININKKFDVYETANFNKMIH